MKQLKKHSIFFFFLTIFFIGAFITAQGAWAKEPDEKTRAASKKAEAKDTGEDGKFVSIDFNNVDINVFIKFISELTGTNFVIDNKVKGKVTIISPSRITEKDAYKVFESVLEVHGFGTVKSGEIVKIIPLPEARTKNIKTLLHEEARETDDKIVTQLISLKYANPSDIKRLVAPLISKSSVILDYDQTGTLIVTDIYSNIVRLMRIIKHIDVQDVGQNISVIPLQFADATKTVSVIDTLFKSTIKRSKKSSDNKEVKFVADERTNSIIVLASEVDTVRVNELIAMLDKEVPKGKEKIHVYYLENAVAEDLAKVLQSLSGKKQAKTVPGKKEMPVVSEDVTITADKATNSLIMMAEKDEYVILEDIIKKLDIPRSMVYIECLIAEVSMDKNFNVGVEWTAGEEVTVNDVDGGAGIGFSGSSNYSNIAGLAGQSTNAPNISVFPAGFSMGIFGEAIQIGDLVFPNLGAVIATYKSDRDVNILSTPQILTTDNEEASITVGKNMPFITKMGTSTTETSYNNYEYKNVGKTLKITPQISKDRQVRLTINLEVTDLDSAGTEGLFTPTTFKRTVDTTVIVKDKSTVVIGGLIDDSGSKQVYKVPCLGDIPILGYLFKGVTTGENKTNLYIFLTPHVVGNPYEAKQLFMERKEQIEKLKEHKISMFNEEKERTSETISEGSPPPEEAENTLAEEVENTVTD